MFFKQPLSCNWLVFILFEVANYWFNKPIGHPASKYFFVMIETSASKSEAILKAWCKSPFILFLLYLLGIWEFQVFEILLLSWNHQGSTLKVVSRILVVFNSIFYSFMFLCWEFMFTNNSSFVAFFYLSVIVSST